MKVKDLIEQLKEMDPEAIVVLSADSEGNRHDTLYQVATGFWNGEEFWGDWEEEEDTPGNGDPAVCLWP